MSASNQISTIHGSFQDLVDDLDGSTNSSSQLSSGNYNANGENDKILTNKNMAMERPLKSSHSTPCMFDTVVPFAGNTSTPVKRDLLGPRGASSNGFHTPNSRATLSERKFVINSQEGSQKLSRSRSFSLQHRYEF